MRLGPGEVGAEACSVEHDHGDEGFGVVEAAGVGADAADGGVVRLGDPVGEAPLDGRFDRGPVAADGAGQFHERGEPRPAGVDEPGVEGSTGREGQGEDVAEFFLSDNRP